MCVYIVIELIEGKRERERARKKEERKMTDKLMRDTITKKKNLGQRTHIRNKEKEKKNDKSITI